MWPIKIPRVGYRNRRRTGRRARGRRSSSFGHLGHTICTLSAPYLHPIGPRGLFDNLREVTFEGHDVAVDDEQSGGEQFVEDAYR